MPVVFTFDLEKYDDNDHARILSLFERLGWQRLGRTSYRYPRLATRQPVEDWFNHVIPALMLFRAYVTSKSRVVTRFSLDTQSSTGYEPEANPVYGSPPMTSSAVKFYKPSNQQFGAKKLKNWLDAVTFPY
jgi:hypothetical protein